MGKIEADIVVICVILFLILFFSIFCSLCIYVK